MRSNIFLSFMMMFSTLVTCQSESFRESLNIVSCDEKTECCTVECLTAAKLLRMSMNSSMDPCEDFYTFACGGFLESTPYPDGREEIGRLEQLHESIFNMSVKVLDDPVYENDTRPTKIVKTLFHTCMNEERIENESVRELREVLDKLGGWPVLSESWNDTLYSLYQQVLNTELTGLKLSPMFYYALYSYDKMYIYLNPGLSILERWVLAKGMNNSKVQEYYKLMVDIITVLGGNESIAKNDMKEVIEVEVSINRVALYNDKTLPDDIYEKIRQFQEKSGKRNITRKMLFRRINVKLSEIDDWIPGFQWNQFFNVIFMEYYNVTDDVVVAIRTPHVTLWTAYLMSTLPNRTLANFILWKFVYEMAPSLGREIRDLSYNFRKTIRHDAKNESRYSQCLSMITNSFAIEFGFSIMEKYFPKSYVSGAKEFMAKMKTHFVESTKNITWMSETVRSKASQKIAAMKETVSFPNGITYAEAAVVAFEHLEVNNVSFLQNFLSVTRYTLVMNLANKLSGASVEPLDYFGGVSESLEFYEKGYNTLNIPIGFLQWILYGNNRTNYLNFGGIGSKVGHTFTHAIDTMGRDYDEKGNWHPWWDNVTKINYETRAECFIEQYNITIEEIQRMIPSSISVLMNFADNFATNLTYTAYLRWTEARKPDKKLPGLNFTDNQLFWLQYASSSCLKQTDESMASLVEWLAQTPMKYRVNLAFGNSIYFRDDWKCTNKTSMGHKNICSAW